jgi:hypothetical protein
LVDSVTPPTAVAATSARGRFFRSPRSCTVAPSNGYTTASRSADSRLHPRAESSDHPNEVRHDDLMVIYPEGDLLKADYFDSEQHVIRSSFKRPPIAR